MIPIQQIDDCFIKIGTPSSNRINFTINYHEKVFFSDEFISPTPTISFDYVFPWLFNGMKKVLDLPHDVITRLQMEGNQDFHKDLIEVIKIQINMLFETKNCIKKYEYLREKISKHTGKLFLNLGETPMISEIYQEAVKQDPKHVFYDSCHFLNDYFRHKETTLPTLENLTEEILSKEIKTIFVHNSLYLRFFLNHHKIFLPAFLKALDIELVILDFDTHNETNGFYYIKRIFNEESFRRFCIFPHIEKYWDKRLEINNVQYIPIPFKIDESDSLRELRSDFSILITTWCRLRYILDYLKPITFFLKYLDPQEPIKDFQYLFQALSFLLQKETHIPLAKKMRLFTYISEIYYHTNSLLKIEIIDQLKTKRKVLLYGDEDWKIFFPNYYQGFLDQNELKNRLSKGDLLPLLLNFNYSYLENNPMYQRVFNANNPYLGFSSVLNIPELEGLKELECASSEDFNSKIEKIHDLSKSENYVKSKNYLAKILNSCIDQFNSHINHPKREPLLFETLTEQYNATFRELTLPHYMETNQKKVEECFQRFITLNDQPIGFERSLFSNRPYFDKILNAYQKLYPEEAIF